MSTAYSPRSVPYINPPHNAVWISYGGHPLLTKIQSTICHDLYSSSIQATICKQEGWTLTQFNQIDWPAHEFAFLRTWSTKRIAYTKLSHKLLNTNVQNKKFYGKSDLCPCCNSFPETIQRLFACSSPDVVEFRRKQQNVLWSQLDLINTPDDIVQAIKCGVLGFEPNTSPQPPPPSCSTVFEDQTSLGWDAFLHGRISCSWQLAFNGDHCSDNSSKRWAGNLVYYLLQYAHQLWVFWCGVVHGYDKDET
jgi:hypothetical protein